MPLPPASPPVRILLADGDATFTARTRGVLQAAVDVSVVGEAADLETLQAQVRALYPDSLDLVLMDLNLPPIGGVLAIGTLLTAYPNLQVVVLGHPLDEWDRVAARRVGATSYLSKVTPPAALVQTVLSYRRGLDPPPLPDQG
jgi:DNA-binding NarL/FixJ family response regulator